MYEFIMWLILYILVIAFLYDFERIQKYPIKLNLTSLKSIPIISPSIDKKIRAVRKRNAFYNRKNVKRCINFKERKIKRIRQIE